MRNVAFGVERTCGLGVLCGSFEGRELDVMCEVVQYAILFRACRISGPAFPDKNCGATMFQSCIHRVLPLEGKRLVVIDKIAVLPC